MTAAGLGRTIFYRHFDAFGREPRVSVERAVQTLTEIWTAVIHRLCCASGPEPVLGPQGA